MSHRKITFTYGQAFYHINSESHLIEEPNSQMEAPDHIQSSLSSIVCESN